MSFATWAIPWNPPTEIKKKNGSRFGLCQRTTVRSKLSSKNKQSLGWSPGLVVKRGDSHSEGCEFKSRLQILDGHFYINLLWNLFLCSKNPKMNETETKILSRATKLFAYKWLCNEITKFEVLTWRCWSFRWSLGRSRKQNVEIEHSDWLFHVTRLFLTNQIALFQPRVAILL